MPGNSIQYSSKHRGTENTEEVSGCFLRGLGASGFFVLELTMELNDLSHAIIGAAIEVHKRLGPGLLESVYRVCLAYELRKRGFQAVEEQPVPVLYDEVYLECGFRADLVVNGMIAVELIRQRRTFIPSMRHSYSRT
jgi:GxxExxY protein